MTKRLSKSDSQLLFSLEHDSSGGYSGRHGLCLGSAAARLYGFRRS